MHFKINSIVVVHVARYLHIHTRAQHIFFKCKKNVRIRSKISSMFGWKNCPGTSGCIGHPMLLIQPVWSDVSKEICWFLLLFKCKCNKYSFSGRGCWYSFTLYTWDIHNKSPESLYAKKRWNSGIPALQETETLENSGDSFSELITKR